MGPHTHTPHLGSLTSSRRDPCLERDTDSATLPTHLPPPPLHPHTTARLRYCTTVPVIVTPRWPPPHYGTLTAYTCYTPGRRTARLRATPTHWRRTHTRVHWSHTTRMPATLSRCAVLHHTGIKRRGPVSRRDGSVFLLRLPGRSVCLLLCACTLPRLFLLYSSNLLL